MSNITFYNVDDNDPRIRYSAGWHSVQNDDAYNGTLHYTTEAGATVTLVFTGTQVGVIGCGGDTEQYGSPTELVVIDGTSYNTDSNFDPDPKVQGCTLQFFASPSLALGEHTIVVTNINGTAPTTFFFDNFWVVPGNGTDAQPSSVGTASSGPTSFPASISASASAPVASGSLSAGSIGSTSSHTQNTAAIVGGAVGGAVGVLLLAALSGYCFWKRRRSRVQQDPRGEAIVEGASTSPVLGGHVPSLSMREAPASTLSSTPLLIPATRKRGMDSAQESVATSAPSDSNSSSALQQEHRLSPGPLLSPETFVFSQPSGTSSLSFDAHSTSFASGYQEGANATHDQPLLSHKLDSASPPPYSQ